MPACHLGIEREKCESATKSGRCLPPGSRNGHAEEDRELLFLKYALYHQWKTVQVSTIESFQNSDFFLDCSPYIIGVVLQVFP